MNIHQSQLFWAVPQKKSMPCGPPHLQPRRLWPPPSARLPAPPFAAPSLQGVPVAMEASLDDFMENPPKKEFGDAPMTEETSMWMGMEHHGTASSAKNFRGMSAMKNWGFATEIMEQSRLWHHHHHPPWGNYSLRTLG